MCIRDRVGAVHRPGHQTVAAQERADVREFGVDEGTHDVRRRAGVREQGTDPLQSGPDLGGLGRGAEVRQFPDQLAGPAEPCLLYTSRCV